MTAIENDLVYRQDGNIGGGPVNADETLYQGTICFVDAVTGGYTALPNGGANKFGGIVREQADNAGGALGDVKVDVYERGTFALLGTGITQADVGKTAYASDNNTVSIDGTNNTRIGTIVGLDEKNNRVLVAIDIQA